MRWQRRIPGFLEKKAEKKMSELRYQVVVEAKDGPQAVSGTAEFAQGPLNIACEAPEGLIRSVLAEVEIDIDNDEKIFVNGYQTWTHSPEFSPSDRQYTYGRNIPQFLKDKFHLDNYGDGFFQDYPKAFGKFKGYSWCYFRKGDFFRLVASLDESLGYTVFSFDALKDSLVIERDCRGVKCGGTLKAFDLFYAEGTEDEVFGAWFDAMGIKPRTPRKLAGYCSWYNRYDKIDEQCMLSDLEGAAKVLRPGDLFQIDDGWQQSVGDWLNVRQDRFPNGLVPIVEKIHGKGFKAGLWLAPFGVQEKSALLEKHPDWLLMPGGKRWPGGINWGGFYALDIDNAEFISYLEEVFDTVLNKWGFDFVKLDFLYAAAPYGTAEESRAGRMIRAMKLLRRLCGDKLILGCGVPLMPAFGLVDYCRIGCDVSRSWEDTFFMRMAHRERVSTKNSIDDTTFRRQLNGRAFMNDPDVFFLRGENCKLTAKEKELLYTANAKYGGLLLCSDDMNKWDQEMIEAYGRIREMFGA